MKYFFALFVVLTLAACSSKKSDVKEEAPHAQSAEFAQIQRSQELLAQGSELLYSKDPKVKNPAKAFEVLQESANLGNPVAMDLLAGFYNMGMAGVKKDCQKSMELYEKSAALGYPLAVNNLAYTLVTCDKKHLRDPARAESLVKLLYQQNTGALALLDTYAAVLATQGDFKQAAKTMEVVIDLLNLVQENPERIDQAKATLALYRKKKTLDDGLEADPNVFKK